MLREHFPLTFLGKLTNNKYEHLSSSRVKHPTEVVPMIDRSRAWRRKKARFVEWKNQVIKEVLKKSPEPENSHRPSPTKQHQQGKLTHAQELRLAYNLRQQHMDAWEQT
jgi:hypothetical protein